jgi:DNA-binding LytR/AlgR family response regulator
MPDLDGLELAAVLNRFARPPGIVFVSAHEDAAVHAFELRALDYLMKPVSRRRIEQAVARVAESASATDSGQHEAAEEAEQEVAADILPVANARGGGTRLVHRSEVLYLQAHGDYVRVVSDEGRFLLRARLTDIERRWHLHGFVRVHRGFVANLHRAVELRPALNGTAAIVFADGSEVPVARRQMGELRRQLGV